MAQPTPYTRIYSFTQWTTDFPATPHPGNRIDAELNAVKLTSDETLRNLARIQRDDYQLANMTVGLEQLKPELALGVHAPTDWVTATTYERHDIVWQGAALYLCNTAHTSGVFATDLAAGKWTAFLDYTDPLGDATTAATNAAASALAADASADAAEASATAADASADAAAASAVEAASYLSSISFPIPIAQGGTNGSTEGQARTNLGVAIGSDVQAYDASLQSLSALATTGDRGVYTTALDTYAEYVLTAVGRTLVGQATQALTRTTGLGFTAAGDALVVAADAAAQRTLLALVPGTNVQAYDADLASWAGITRTAYFDTLPAAVDAAALRTLLALGTAAVETIGTSGGTVPKNNTANTFSATLSLSAALALDVLSSRGGNPETTGSTMTTTGARIYRSGIVSCDVGVYGSGTLWIQHRNATDFTSNFPIALNPNGGAVTINGNTAFHTANLPGTAIDWTVAQAFSSLARFKTGQYAYFDSAAGSARGYIGASGGSLDAAAAPTDFIIRFEDVLRLSRAGTTLATMDSGGLKNASGVPYRIAGKTGIPIPAGAMIPATTSGAAYALSETTTNKVMVQTYDFDPGSQEFVHVCMAMPKGWNEGTVTAQFCYTATATGAVMWGFQGAAVSDDDPVDVAWGTQQDILDSVTAANDVMWTAETPALTIGGSPAEGDLVFFRFCRNAGNGSDTCAVDARLISVRLHLTTNAANDA